MLSQQFDKPLCVTHYPGAVKAFYMKENPADPRTVLCDDCLAPEGYGEIIGGSQREDDHDDTREQTALDGAEPLGASAVLEFVGETRTSLYGTTNRYTLSVDAASARRPSVSALDAAQANRERDRWRAEVVRSNDTLYSLGALGDDPWYDSLLAASAGTPASNTYALDLPADATLEGASLALQVEGETEWPQADDHRLDIMVNGVAIARHEFDGRAAESVRYPLPPGALHAGENQVTLTLPADQGVPFDRVRVQGVSIRYDSSLQASDGRLDADGICRSVPDWKQAGVWFCGPAGFGAMLRDTLAARGLPAERFHQELFEMR